MTTTTTTITTTTTTTTTNTTATTTSTTTANYPRLPAVMDMSGTFNTIPSRSKSTAATQEQQKEQRPSFKTTKPHTAHVQKHPQKCKKAMGILTSSHQSTELKAKGKQWISRNLKSSTEKRQHERLTEKLNATKIACRRGPRGESLFLRNKDSPLGRFRNPKQRTNTQWLNGNHSDSFIVNCKLQSKT